MADIADEAQGAEEQLIAQGLTSIRAQLSTPRFMAVFTVLYHWR